MTYFLTSVICLICRVAIYVSVLPLASARLSKLWHPFRNHMLVEYLCKKFLNIHILSFFRVFNQDFIIYIDFTCVAAAAFADKPRFLWANGAISFLVKNLDRLKAKTKWEPAHSTSSSSRLPSTASNFDLLAPSPTLVDLDATCLPNPTTGPSPDERREVSNGGPLPTDAGGSAKTESGELISGCLRSSQPNFWS